MNAFAPYRENQATDGSFSDFHDVFAALSEDSSMLPSSVTCESDDDTDVPSASIAPPRQRKRKFTGHMPAQSTSQPSFLRNAISAVAASGTALAPTTMSAASASLPPAPRSAATLRHVARQRASTAWPNVYLKKLRRFVSDPDSGLDGDHADDEEEEDEDFVNSPYLSPTVSPTRRQVTTHFGGGVGGVGGGGDESLEPYMKILEQPESHYRARYACEGCRGPMKSRSAETTNENVFPTVQIMNYMGSATVNVYLVTTSGDPHYHVLVPGSSRTSNCKASLVDGTPSLELSLNGEEMEDMIAVLDNLSIRRLRRWEGDRKLKNRGVDPATFKKDRVQAALMFQATIFTQDGVRVLKCQSEPFQCTAPKGSPEISWISHDSGPASGGNEIGLIGSRFNKGCKVRFYNDNWETYATLDRAKSNQGGAVVEVPPFENVSITEPEKVCIEIRIGPEKNPQLSDPVEYTYMPEKGSEFRRSWV
ncbi:nuclear factor of activated T-cells 5-like isoform X2 [Oscarella lobularis]|uniref:nuclear factor of activated T-cells 5-like isoform X2 n=1 Tax=Oscarella lobularis TaxID=121494 RepID=UPI003313728B